jgi:hypothetical protein
VRPFLAGLAFASVVFLVVAGPQLLGHPPVETNPPTGPGDTQNITNMNAAYDAAIGYRNGAVSWGGTWASKRADAKKAMDDAKAAYNARMYKQPPMTQGTIDYYNSYMKAAQDWVDQADGKNSTAQSHMVVGDADLVDGAEWESDGYYYYACCEYVYSYSSLLDPINEDGPFPWASLRWAQGIDFCNNAITQANNAKAVCQ